MTPKVRVGKGLGDTRPASGLGLEDAMVWYANDQKMAQELTSLRVLGKISTASKSIDLKSEHKIKLESYTLALIEDLIAHLRSGALAARGIAVGATISQDIPLSWWSNVEVDLEDSSATSSGIAFTHITVHGTETSKKMEQAGLLGGWIQSAPATTIVRRRGSKGNRTQIATGRIVEDVISGRKLRADLDGTKLTLIAMEYGLSSHTTARTALNKAYEILDRRIPDK